MCVICMLGMFNPDHRIRLNSLSLLGELLYLVCVYSIVYCIYSAYISILMCIQYYCVHVIVACICMYCCILHMKYVCTMYSTIVHNMLVYVYMRIQVADTKAVGLAPGGEDDGDDDLGAAAAGTHTCLYSAYIFTIHMHHILKCAYTYTLHTLIPHSLICIRQTLYYTILLLYYPTHTGSKIINTIRSHVGEQTANALFASLYIARSDLTSSVRHAALQVRSSTFQYSLV